MLSLLTLLYLALPYSLFAGGWLKPPLAVLVWMLLASGLAIAMKSGVTNRPPSVVAPAPRTRLLISVGLLLAALTATYWAGVGGLTFQQTDWFKHNAILNDLATTTWPVTYQGSDNTSIWYLTYYFAYYLPAALIGRFAGLAAAQYTLFIWTALGLWLTLHWVHRLSGASVWLIVGGWFLFSGMDLIGVVAYGGSLRNLPTAQMMEWWAGLAQYSSNASLLQWVPQHALGGWLATAPIIACHEEGRGNRPVLFCLALSTLWSPFATLGLLPLILASSLRQGLRPNVSLVDAAVAIPLGLLPVLFLKSVNTDGILGGLIAATFGWLPWLRFWSLFCLLEFGLYGIMLALLVYRSPENPILHNREASRFWLWPVLGTLLVLPCFQLGEYNDLAMRASIPSLFLLWVLILRLRWRVAVEQRPWLSAFLLLSLALGAVQPLRAITEQVSLSRPLRFAPPQPKGGKDNSLTNSAGIPQDLIFQYLGDQNSFFYRYLAAAPVPPSEK